MMLAVLSVLTSCLSNDTDSVTYDDVAVTQFKLGSVKCYRTVKTSAGKDSTYTYTYSASSVAIYIDHVNHTIYNVDSLAVGADLQHLLVTISTKNSGIATLKNLDGDGYTLYSSSDSLDFSQPRTLRVVSNDGNHTADYTVNIVAHKEYADSFTWTRMPYEAKIAAMTKMQSATVGSRIFLFGYSQTGTTTLLRTTDASSWEECTLPTTDLTDATIASDGANLLLCAGGALYTTTDGYSWTTAAQSADLQAILGGCASEVYALSTAGKILVSTDGGATWAEDALESTTYVDNTQYLPATDISVTASTTRTNSDVTRIVMVGNKAYTGADDTYAYAVAWSKIVDPDAAQAWMYITPAWENYAYRLPRLEGLATAGYNDGIVAIGGTPVNNTAAAYSKIYYSPDCGATWHQQANLSMPSGFSTVTAATIASDGKGYFYLIGANAAASDNDTQCIVWRGKLNKLLWTDPTKYYE